MAHRRRRLDRHARALQPCLADRLAVDLHGRRSRPGVTLPACRAFLAAHPAAELVLVGRADAIAQAAGWPRCTRIAASEVVEMTDSVETALRRKKDSSLRVAVEPGQAARRPRSLAQACVSAGNTGALMAVSRYVLKTIDGIDRPAIATVMPNEQRRLHDRARPRRQRRLHGRAPAAVRRDGQRARRRRGGQGRADGRPAQHRRGSDQGQRGRSRPRASCCARRRRRGSSTSTATSKANDIFKGTTDIVVCDGFVGNVMLKTAEGLASMLDDLHQAGVQAQRR